jgi:hypothetical protein
MVLFLPLAHLLDTRSQQDDDIAVMIPDIPIEIHDHGYSAKTYGTPYNHARELG